MRFVIIVAIIFAVCAAIELPTLNLRREETTVSGLSSGGFFAAQFQVAHSRHIKSAGIFAGGPWGCAQG